MNCTRITVILVPITIIILTVASLAPSAALFAYSDDNSQIDLNIPTNAGRDTGTSVVPLAGQNTITTQAHNNNNNNNNNRLAACANQPSQNKGTVPPFCVGHLVLIKHVINDNGGTNTAKDFTIGVNRPVPGAESPGTDVTLTTGPFNVSEKGPAGYTQSLSGDCSGTINPGDNKVCTITNNDNPNTGGSITITSIRCLTDPHHPLAIEMTISGQSHDSHPITVEIQIFSPDGHIVTLYQYIVPADAPDPATTFLGTAIGVGLEPSPIPPIVPGGTYRVVAVTSEGQSMSTTFQAPDCSQP